MNSRVRTGLFALATLALSHAFVTTARAETGQTIEVTTGKAVSRSWDQIKSAEGMPYGPKQDYDAKKKETRVYLPYGTKGAYFEVKGLKLSNPGEDGGAPLAVTIDGETSGSLVYKLHFDKPITSFKFFAGWSEWGVSADSVGGVEYSTDGQAWTVLREVNQAKIIEPLSDGKKAVENLNTQDLYIRLFSRGKEDPTAERGPGRWMKLRMGGDPGWGDVSSTFFKNQMQVTVTTAE